MPEHSDEIDQQRFEWERFVKEQHDKGMCESSGLRAARCVRSVCDCFESPEGAAAMERGECGCPVCSPANPRVQVDSYVVYPSCWDQMGNSDRDVFCLSVTNGHAWGWRVHRFGFTGREALDADGEWVYESRGALIATPYDPAVDCSCPPPWGGDARPSPECGEHSTPPGASS